MTTIPHPLQSAALSRAEHVALEDGTTTIRYGELLQEVCSLAAALGEAGVEPGQCVALVGDYGLQWVVGLHAIGWLGAIAVPLPLEATRDEQLKLGRAAGVKAWLCSESLVTRLEEEGVPVICLAARRKAEQGERYWALEETRFKLATSGSTGEPRIVSITTAQLFFSAMGSMIRLGHDLSDRWLCALPLHHVGGLSMLMRALWAGVTLEFAWPFNADKFAQRIHAGDISLCSLVPEMLRRVLVESKGATAPKFLRALLVGGDACPSDVLEGAKAAGYPVALTWGMTESASQVATRFPGDFGDTGSGPSLSFARVKEEAGNLVVEGPVVASNRLVTSDCGFIDELGCVHVLGRADDIMISGGENIAPRKIEEALLACGQLESVAVVDAPHSRWGQRPVAFIVAGKNARLTNDEFLREYLQTHLNSFEIPDIFYLVQMLPQAGIGKLDRKTLRIVAGTLGLGREVKVPDRIQKLFGDITRLEGGKFDDDMNELTGAAQVSLGTNHAVVKGDGSIANLGGGHLDGQALSESHRPLVVSVGVNEGHTPFPVVKNVGDTVAHREQEFLEDGVAVLVDSTIKGDPCAVDLIETNSDDMLKSHGCSGNQSEGSCDESL